MATIPQNFTREEIAELIRAIIPEKADPKEILNGMLMAAGEFTALCSANPTSDAACIGLYKTYIAYFRNEINK